MTINERNFANINLNLTITFLVMFRECNVSRTAELLRVRQPAVSGALARLRQHFDDPLFLRTGQGMRPTARASQIAQALLPPMSLIESIFTGRGAGKGGWMKAEQVDGNG